MAKRTQPTQSAGTLRTMIVVAVLALSVTLGVFFVNRPSPGGNPGATQAMHMPDHVPPEPSWLRNALQPVRQAYIYAASNDDLLKYIPCYCGCGNIHASNSACYYKRDQEGKVLAYDQHAYG